MKRGVLTTCKQLVVFLLLVEIAAVAEGLFVIYIGLYKLNITKFISHRSGMYRMCF